MSCLKCSASQVVEPNTRKSSRQIYDATTRLFKISPYALIFKLNTSARIVKHAFIGI